jgi:hypothetical protein
MKIILLIIIPKYTNTVTSDKDRGLKNQIMIVKEVKSPKIIKEN